MERSRSATKSVADFPLLGLQSGRASASQPSGKSDSQRVAAHVDRWKQQTRQQSPKVAAQVSDRRIAVVNGRTTFNGVSID